MALRDLAYTFDEHKDATTVVSAVSERLPASETQVLTGLGAENADAGTWPNKQAKHLQDEHGQDQAVVVGACPHPDRYTQLPLCRTSHFAASAVRMSSQGRTRVTCPSISMQGAAPLTLKTRSCHGAAPAPG